MSSDLPTSSQLLQLRRRLVVADSLNEFETQLKKCRDSMIQTLKTGLAEQLYEEFNRVWTVLSKADETAWLYCPPIYQDDKLRELLINVVTQICQRERGRITNSTNNIGHTVFGGIEGTGKTTLVRAIVIAAAVLLSVMIPVTHTVGDGDTTTLEQLMSEVMDGGKASLGRSSASATSLRRSSASAANLHRSSAPAASLDSSALAALKVLREDQRHELLLALDEFQNVFALAPKDSVPARLQIATDVKELSRSFGTYGVIAGSSSDMRSRMFRSGTDENPDMWRRAGFPDFNASLYTLYEVPALRDTGSLAAFLGQRYPLWTLTGPDVSKLLFWSGGIGRVIHAGYLSIGATAATSTTGVVRVVQALRSMEGTDGTRRIPPARILDDIEGRLVVTMIVMAHLQAIERPLDEPLPCLGIPRGQLLQGLRLYKVDDAEKLVRRLIDGSILYSCGNEIQLARPCDADVYMDSRVPARFHILLLVAVSFMVNGIPCGDSAEDTVERIDNNAGTPLERLVSGRVAFKMSLTPTERSRVLCVGWRVAISDGALHVCEPNSDTWLPLNNTRLTAIDGQLLKWRGETGLDGVLFLSSPEGSWALHGWQCRGGRRDVEVTGGDLATSVNLYVRSLEISREKERKRGAEGQTMRQPQASCSCLDDSTSHGILVKAQVGMCKLILAWHASTEALPALLPASLLLTTTKDAAKALKSIEKLRNVMTIDKRVAIATGVPTAAWVTAVIGAKITITVLDGTKWLRDCVPSDVASIIPSLISHGSDGAGAPSRQRGCILM